MPQNFFIKITGCYLFRAPFIFCSLSTLPTLKRLKFPDALVLVATTVSFTPVTTPASGGAEGARRARAGRGASLDAGAPVSPRQAARLALETGHRRSVTDRYPAPSKRWGVKANAYRKRAWRAGQEGNPPSVDSFPERPGDAPESPGTTRYRPSRTPPSTDAATLR